MWWVCYVISCKIQCESFRLDFLSIQHATVIHAIERFGETMEDVQPQQMFKIYSNNHFSCDLLWCGCFVWCVCVCQWCASCLCLCGENSIGNSSSALTLRIVIIIINVITAITGKKKTRFAEGARKRLDAIYILQSMYEYAYECLLHKMMRLHVKLRLRCICIYTRMRCSIVRVCAHCDLCLFVLTVRIVAKTTNYFLLYESIPKLNTLYTVCNDKIVRNGRKNTYLLYVGLCRDKRTDK